jgi:hypothetical protein
LGGDPSQTLPTLGPVHHESLKQNDYKGGKDKKERVAKLDSKLR